MSSRGRVFLVEDEADIREVIRDIVELEGYEITCAVNGQDALAQLATIPIEPNLILLDLWMPVMTGFEFLQKRVNNQQLSAIPVVVLSGDLDLPQKTASLGVAGHLAKPIDLDLLLDAIHRFIRQAA